KLVSEQMHGHNPNTATTGQPIILNSHAYKVKFLGGSSFAQNVPDKIQPYHNNYFVGNDQSKWASDCKIAQAVSYQNIYPNIDVRFYSDGGNMKYDIIVRPGGNINKIAMQYDGVDKLEVKNKELLINTPVASIKELYPYSYQVQDGKRKTVDCRYVVKNNIVRFKVDDYDPNTTVIIDPSLIFSTFTGSTADNWGYTATPGPDGSFYAGGIAFGAGFPVSPGAYKTVFGGGVNEDGTGVYDMAIIKFSPNGGSRVFATYIGGNGNEQPHSMICDAAGNLVIGGRSNSVNYPGTLIGNGGGYDIVVTKLNAVGTVLMGSIRVGGSGADGVNIRGKYFAPDGADATRRNYGDDARSEVIIDAAGNVMLASCTQSSGPEATGGFPVRNSLIQTTFGNGRQDGVILKFTPNLSAVLFSTYFGGSGDDACFVLSQSPTNGHIYVAGGTTSANLPGTNSAVIQQFYGGGAVDGFITEILNDGSAIVRTTYQGTTGNDLVYGIQFDKQGFPYIMGTTTGNWSVFNATFSHTGGKQFISKLKPDLSGPYVYSTVFGTNAAVPNLSPTAFLVDRCENVYVSGWGGGINNAKLYPSAGTSGLPEVNPLLNSSGQPYSQPDGQDFYFFVLEKNARSQLFGSHFGQTGSVGDHVDGGTSRFDDNGVIYQAICGCGAGGTLFPTTNGAYSRTNNAPFGGCNLAAVKIEMNFGGVGANIRTLINNLPDAISGCNPLKVVAFDSLSKAVRFFWNWGDGSKIDTLTGRSDTSHVYNLPTGVDEAYFTIMLIAEDSSTCNIRDTAFKKIRVSTNFATLGLSFVKLSPCTNLTYQFKNESRAFIGSFDNKGFIWDFGDGVTDTGSISYNPIHQYASPGSYRVKLCVVDTFVCNSPDCIDTLLSVATVVKAGFITNPRSCVGAPLTFTNTSTGGQTYIWEFGDNTTSTDPSLSVTHIYNTPGTYKVRLIAFNPNTCNLSDTSGYFSVTVFDIPTADFDWTPNPPQENKPTRFNNKSIGATRYVWDFGDGETSTEVNPVHQYNATATFSATLYAYNVANCVDSLTLDVPILIVPLLDVPNAFTPGRFGKNGIVKVEGFGIGVMNWKIYNRWGQVVFATSDRNQGWDGTFKGVLQPMDVYTYTLDVEFTDGKKHRKTGDITLLR
ncbi:MAG: PKD domain-containing protein, partial [Ferruginibacter sp.]